MPAAKSPGPITKKSGGPRVKKLQQGIRKTLKGHGFEKWAKGVIVDGKPGPMTFKMARLAGSMQGLSKEQLKKIGNGTITRHAELILIHEKPRSAAMKRAAKKRDKHFDHLRHELKHPPVHEGVTSYDGHSVAGWMVPYCEEARQHGWTGHIVSGYRTPEYSRHLCEAMCGAPSCPGTCAGEATNHACPPSHKCVKYEGAIDVSDYYTFKRIMGEIGAPLHNDLPSDPVHFSYSGH